MNKRKSIIDGLLTLDLSIFGVPWTKKVLWKLSYEELVELSRSYYKIKDSVSIARRLFETTVANKLRPTIGGKLV